MAKNNKKGGKDPWNQFDYGSSFSAQDIKRAEEAGYSQNQILKIAASASSVKNSANKTLGQFNNTYTDPKQGMTGSAGLVASYMTGRRNDAAGNKDPNKVLTWNGLNANGTANALTINKPTGDIFGTYSPNQGGGGSYGQWTVPTKYQGGPGGGGGSGGGGGGGSGGGSGGGTAPGETAPGNPTLTMPGTDVRLLGENLGIKARRSKADKAGLTKMGTSRLTIPRARSAGVSGLNIG